MRIIKNINSATAYALYNKGVKTLCAALDSLTKGDRKKMADYLVVPNNCVLSLSLSQVQAQINHYLSYSYARVVRRTNPCRQRTYSKFSLPYLYAMSLYHLKRDVYTTTIRKQ